MTTANSGICWQCSQTFKGIQHLLGRTFEQAAAADAEECVSTKQQVFTVESNVAAGMSGHADDVELALRRGDLDAVSIDDAMGCQADAWIVRSMNRDVRMHVQASHPADVIRVMMRQQNGTQLQMLAAQFIEHGFSLTRIDDKSVAKIVVQHPYVVVAERGDWFQMKVRHEVNYSDVLCRELPAVADDCGKLPGQQPDSQTLTPVQLLPASIFELPEIKNLLAQEWGLVGSSSLSVADGPMLSIAPEAMVGVREKRLPTSSHLTRIYPRGSEIVGDLRCSPTLLPIESESLQLIVARHVFDVSSLGDGIGEELVRILAPGGLLVVFGFNPVSSWRLWWLRQALGGMQMPDWCGASQVRRRLSTIGCLSGHCEFLGGSWPSASALIGQAQGRRWHGAWSLTARKELAASRPVHLRARRTRVALDPGLAQSPARRIGL
jgi:hypothetical protein